MSVLEVVGFGAMNMDYLYRVKKITAEGEQVVEDFKLMPGGSAANTIYRLAKLEINTGFVGVVGEDENGKALLEDFEVVGVNTSQIQIKKRAKTGSTLCLSDKSGKRALYVLPNANSLFNTKDINLDYLKQAKIVHLSSFANDEQFNVQINMARELTTSIKIAFAPGMLYALKGLGTLAPLIKRTHILFTNKPEIEQLTGKDFKAGAKDCLSQGCHIIVITLGKGSTTKKGDIITSYICSDSEECKIKAEAPASRLQLETTGAGDAFAAGFLFGFLKGRKLEECGLLGNIMAQSAIGNLVAREGALSLAQIPPRYR